MQKNIKVRKNKYSIQDGKIAYSDLNKPGKLFFSKRYRISGKPDYIIKKGKQYIPVEVKSGKNKNPQKSHILQLAGYCQLIEENYGGFVPYGILVYNNLSNYKIPYNPSLRFEFESTIKNMRYILKSGIITRNHRDSFRCKSCSMQIYCKYRLL